MRSRMLRAFPSRITTLSRRLRPELATIPIGFSSKRFASTRKQPKVINLPEKWQLELLREDEERKRHVMLTEQKNQVKLLVSSIANQLRRRMYFEEINQQTLELLYVIILNYVKELHQKINTYASATPITSTNLKKTYAVLRGKSLEGLVYAAFKNLTDEALKILLKVEAEAEGKKVDLSIEQIRELPSADFKPFLESKGFSLKGRSTKVRYDPDTDCLHFAVKETSVKTQVSSLLKSKKMQDITKEDIYKVFTDGSTINQDINYFSFITGHTLRTLLLPNNCGIFAKPSTDWQKKNEESGSEVWESKNETGTIFSINLKEPFITIKGQLCEEDLEKHSIFLLDLPSLDNEYELLKFKSMNPADIPEYVQTLFLRPENLNIITNMHRILSTDCVEKLNSLVEPMPRRTRRNNRRNRRGGGVLNTLAKKVSSLVPTATSKVTQAVSGAVPTAVRIPSKVGNLKAANIRGKMFAKTPFSFTRNTKRTMRSYGVGPYKQKPTPQMEQASLNGFKY